MQAYLKKNKLGKYNEEEMAALSKEKEEREAAEAKMVSGATIGAHLKGKEIVSAGWLKDH